MLVIDDTKTVENIAANVRRLLDRRGWTQADLAERSGESQMNISRLCRGKNTPSVTTVARVADAFGFPIDALISAVPENIAQPA